MEEEESERVYLLLILFTIPSFTYMYLARLSEKKTEAEEQTIHNARHRTLVYFASFAFASDCDNLVLTRS